MGKKPRLPIEEDPSEADTFVPVELGTAYVVRRLAREYVLPHWRVFTVTIVAMLFTAATAGALPFLMQQVADRVFVGQDRRLLYAIPVALIVVMSVRALATWVSAVGDAWLGNRIVADLRIRMFDTVARADLSWVQRMHSGRFVSAFVSDTPRVNNAAAKTMTALFKDGVTVLVLLGGMFYMDWRLSLLVLVGLPVMVINLGRQKKKIRSSVRHSMREAGELGTMLTQTLQGIRVVKAYRQEERESRRFSATAHRVAKYLTRTSRSRAAVGPVTEALSGVGFAAAVFYGGWQGIAGNVSLGHFMGFMTAAMLMYQPLKSLATTQATLSEGVLAAGRVFGIIDYASHVTEAPHARPLRTVAGAVAFRNVSFGYDPARPVLTDFSLDIAPGEKIALVGRSGAGKSTVLNLILRFYDPAEGAVLIDGQDIREATLTSLREAVALLTQEPVIFDDTIAANIAYGAEGASDEEIEAAARAAAAHDFICRMPEGYQSRAGEAGNRLSGGERQRIAFARAMLRSAPILLLDEPTSALDAESESKVQRAMDELLRDRTVVMIAHRLSTVKKADRICVMEAGRIVESGSHDELMARGGAYSRMVAAQFPDAPAPVLQAVGG